MTYKDGSTFESGPFMTTTDSLQIVYTYCDQDVATHANEFVNCPTNDKTSVLRPVYSKFRFTDNLLYDNIQVALITVCF